MARIKKKQQLASLIVTQANELVESRYNLTLGEQRLIFTMIAKIQPDDEDFKPYSIRLHELAEFLGINKNHIYTDCKKITKNLLEKVVEIKEPGRLLQTHWVSSADYVDGTGMVNLTFDPLLKPYLLQLKGNFTSSRLEMLLSFKSQYTMRMYNLLKQYERLKERDVEVDYLRSVLGLRKDQYQRYNDFKKDILEATRKEIETKSDLYFEFDEIKEGRKISVIKFRIFTKKLLRPLENQEKMDGLSVKLTVLNPENIKFDELILLVPEQHRAKKTINSALQLFEAKQGFDYVKRNILYCNAKADKSYAGFLHNALKNDWGHDWEIEQQNQSKKTKRLNKQVWELQGFASEKEYAETMFRRQYENVKNNK